MFVCQAGRRKAHAYLPVRFTGERDMSCDGGEWIATFEGGVSISVIHIVDPDLWEAAAG